VLELRDRRIALGCEVEVNVHYKGRLLTCSYRADLICFPHDIPVLVELKACERLTHAHRAQVIHYMKATQIQRALLTNFGGTTLRFNARGLATRPCSWSSLYSLRSYSSGRAYGNGVGRVAHQPFESPRQPQPLSSSAASATSAANTPVVQMRAYPLRLVRGVSLDQR